MVKMGLTPSASCAQKASFMCSRAHIDVQLCFSVLNLSPEAQFYTGLILSILFRRCQPVIGLFC